uniref:uncharacterized protein LOC120337331 n=1 Tax=Styela clava TaxID=7725 RepID=UPI00193995C5|nr:uncharacterized protein LOC120337331 [Styela clava]
MFAKILLMLSVVSSIRCNQEERMDNMIHHLSKFVDENADPEFDVVDNEDAMAEIRKIIEDHGFNSDDLLSDISFLYGIPGIFKSGDAKRWASVNFSYQLACYSGKTGSLLSQAWWAYTRFNEYGCYCGGGNYYGNYLDATDHCCKVHDRCYDRVQSKFKLALGCHTYTTPYTVSCCKDQKYTKCTDSGPSGGRGLCECDQAMAKCVAATKGSYNPSLLKNRSNCRDPNGKKSKPLSPWEILKTCKHAFSPVVTVPLTYGSQGTCPKSGGSSGWFWG